MITKALTNTTFPISVLQKVHLPAQATAAVVTLAATAGKRWVIHAIQSSYSAAPTGGRLSISGLVGAVTFDIDITLAGPTILSPTFVGIENTDVVVTLASGAGSVVGKLNVQATLEAE